MKPSKSVYTSLSGLNIISKSYSLKFLFIAFLGIHIPLIGVILYLLFGPVHLKPMPVFFLVLVLTLVATGVTLFLLNGLLHPLKQSKIALEQYLDDRTLPCLPLNYNDEAGILMQKVQLTITALNSMLEEKRDLASLLSHDLRQPLSIISTAAEAIKYSDDRETIEHFCNNIGKMADEQLHLLDDVLQLLRYDVLFAHQQEMTTVPVENFLEDIVEVMGFQADLKEVRILNEVRYHGLATFNIDLFRQVLKNLLHNAIKFSYPGGKIHLITDSKNGNLVFSIKDEGKGFAPELKEILFDRFTNAGQKGTNDEPSTGIGLHICRKIVELHHGSVSAFSAGSGKGATFTVSIPGESKINVPEKVKAGKESVLSVA